MPDRVILYRLGNPIATFTLTSKGVEVEVHDQAETEFVNDLMLGIPDAVDDKEITPTEDPEGFMSTLLTYLRSGYLLAEEAGPDDDEPSDAKGG
jgi:hypothetical protein